jgi:hypothetical protein
VPPWTDDRSIHYPARFTLTDREINHARGPLEARIVYEQDSAFDARDQYAGLRRLVWDREADWERRFKNPVRPALSSECFRVDRGTLIKINRSMRALASRVGPFEFEELITDQIPRPEGTFKIARTPARRRRVIFGAEGARVDVDFTNKWFDRSFNRAWERAWATLGSVMTDENSFGTGRFASHGMKPEQFARFLHGEGLS